MRPWRPLMLLIAMVGLAVLEIYVIVQVGEAIGIMPTILLLIAESALGLWVVKREGRRAWRALSAAVSGGGLPGRELADAAVVLLGGVLLITPGFVTDLLGFFCVVPLTRPLARRLLSALVVHRVGAYGVGRFAPRRRGAHRIYSNDPPHR